MKSLFHLKLFSILLVLGLISIAYLVNNVPNIKTRQELTIDQNVKDSTLNIILKQPTIIIVTASSSNHYEVTSTVLLPSIRKHTNPFITKVIFFDIGITILQRSELIDQFPEVQLRIFDFEKYPSHFSLEYEVGHWAWKPVIIENILKEYPRSTIIWLDGGNKLIGSVNKLVDHVKMKGMWSQRTSGKMKKFVHPGTFAYLQVDPKPFLHLPNCDGAMVAFYGMNETTNSILRDWVKCAMVKDCIAPPGSSRENHRQDQAVLTLLMRINGFRCKKDDGKKFNILKHLDKKPEAERAIKEKLSGRKSIRLLTAVNFSTYESFVQGLALRMYQQIDPWAGSVIVFDFGMSFSQRTHFLSLFPMFQLEPIPEVGINFSPSMDSLSVWKPFLLQRMIRTCNSCLFVWIDPGITLPLLIKEFITSKNIKSSIWANCRRKGSSFSLSLTEEVRKALIRTRGKPIDAIKTGYCNGDIIIIKTSNLPKKENILDIWIAFLSNKVVMDTFDAKSTSQISRIVLSLLVHMNELNSISQE